MTNEYKALVECYLWDDNVSVILVTLPIPRGRPFDRRGASAVSSRALFCGVIEFVKVGQ